MTNVLEQPEAMLGTRDWCVIHGRLGFSGKAEGSEFAFTRQLVVRIVFYIAQNAQNSSELVKILLEKPISSLLSTLCLVINKELTSCL